MSIIIDIVVCLLILIIAFICYRRGFLATLLGLCGSLVSLFAAFKLSPVVADLLYDKLFKAKIAAGIAEKLNGTFSSTADAVKSVVPEFITRSAGTIGINISEAVGGSSLSNTAVLAEDIESSVVSPVVLLILRVVIMLLLFVLISFLVRLLAKIFKGFNSIPLVGPLNRLLGFLLGIVNGAVLAIVICAALSSLVTVFGGKLLFLTQRDIEGATIFKFFAGMFSAFDPSTLIK